MVNMERAKLEDVKKNENMHKAFLSLFSQKRMKNSGKSLFADRLHGNSGKTAWENRV